MTNPFPFFVWRRAEVPANPDTVLIPEKEDRLSELFQCPVNMKWVGICKEGGVFECFTRGLVPARFSTAFKERDPRFFSCLQGVLRPCVCRVCAPLTHSFSREFRFAHQLLLGMPGYQSPFEAPTDPLPLDEQLAHAEVRARLAEERAQRAEAENRELKQRVTSLEVQITANGRTLERANAVIAELQARLAASDARAEAMAADFAELRARFTWLEAEHAKCQK